MRSSEVGKMIEMLKNDSEKKTAEKSAEERVNNRARKDDGESGAALAITVIIIVILAIVGLTALAFSSSEVRIAGSDLQRTQTFYATAAAIEKMTNDFGNLFRTKLNPTQADLNSIASKPPPSLDAEFDFSQTLVEDSARLADLRAVQGLPNTVYPRVNILDGPYAGLYASVIPYKLTSMGTMTTTKTQVKLEREFNNYLVPLFQFGMFSNDDIEIHPGPLLTFNGRIHSNKNIYALQNTMFLNRVTAAGEFVRDAWRSGKANTDSGANNVWVRVNGVDVKSTVGSGSVKAGSGAIGGPNILNSKNGQRGYYPGSPSGIANPNWETDSVKAPGTTKLNNFGGQVLTRSTGAIEVKLPLEIGGNSPAELIKRQMPADSEILAASRYHKKAQIRILIDDATAGNGTANVAGIPAGKGVVFSNTSLGFSPIPLANGNVLRRVDNSGNYLGADKILKQKKSDGTTQNALTVRGIKNIGETINGNYIPPGAGIEGRILIEIVKPDDTTVDVTKEILSMGMTEGEPNGIVYLQRPMWSAFVQGSRDRTGSGFDLVNLTRNFQSIADGEITTPNASQVFPNRGFLDMDENSANDDGSTPTRQAVPTSDGSVSTPYNEIVPINVYNVREGWVRSTMEQRNIYYDRGVTSVVELNMRNLARWLDGIYDKNLLLGTNAVSTNINGTEGYVVYVSDRRGDKPKPEYLSTGVAYMSTNGTVDNEDIYGPNGILDAGEDVIDFGWDATKGGAGKKGTLQNDTNELPNTGAFYPVGYPWNSIFDRLDRALLTMRYQNKYFRRSVRLFDGATLSFTAAAGKLSPTKGITVSSENMIYIWGNFNATGITGMPANGSTLNNGGFTGAQVPASIVCDAFFPLSKTWFDASSALYPEGLDSTDIYRKADENLPSTAESTTVRAAILAGSNLSAMTGAPGRNVANEKINGGMHNYPRFLETWGWGSVLNPWNYTGSLVPLFHSTQALSQYEDAGPNVYVPPRRNWSFDETFLTPQNLPPGTPFFQYVQATGFRQVLR